MWRRVLCGWTPWTKHEMRPGRYLNVIGEEICQVCGARFMVHKYYPGAIPWDDECERFFEARLRMRAR